MKLQDYNVPDDFAYKYYRFCIEKVSHLATSDAAKEGLAAIRSTKFSQTVSNRAILGGSYLTLQLSLLIPYTSKLPDHLVSVAIHDLITALLIGPAYMTVLDSGMDIPRLCLAAHRKSKFLGFLRKDWTRGLLQEMMDKEFTEFQKVMMLK